MQWVNTAKLAALGALLTCAPSFAQVTLYGTLANFDVVNDTGSEVHGLEIEFHGSSNIYSYFNWNRYGNPAVVPFPGGGGIWVRWMSPYDAVNKRFLVATPNAVQPTRMTGHQCIIGTPSYATSGCEHFGISVVGNPTKTIYRWLEADPANPGQLRPRATMVAIPAPVWSVQPPVRPADPPIVVADVDPPVPPPPAKRYGPAQWMKTFKTENARQVDLNELVADNPVVPEDPAEIETDWDLIQEDAQDRNNGRRRRKQGALGGGNHAVVRRFELYKYTGAVDPLTGEALCLDGTCSAPADSEVGDFIGAQNAAANLDGPNAYPVTVTVVGDGLVQSSPAATIKCPGTCTMSVVAGQDVTLTATNKKGVFSGWTGACQGNNPVCTINVNSNAPVTATFKSTYRLVLKANGTGTVSSNPAGSSFVEGSSVTVTAVPGAGATWKGWTGGGCTGLGLSCTVTIKADTNLTANFR